MSKTNFAVGDPLAAKYWSTKLQRSIPKDSWFMKSGFVGEDVATNCILVVKDLVGQPGDQLTYAIVNQLRGYTTPGDQRIVGKAKKLVYLDDRISINQQRSAVNSGGKMSNKRVSYDTQADSKKAQSEMWGVRLDEEFIGKLAGTMGVGQWETLNPDVNGFDVEGAIDSDGNLLRAPSSNRHVFAGTAGTKVGMTASDKFSLDMVDTALLKVTRLQTNTVTRRKMIPLRIGGKNVWVCLMDVVHAFDLKRATGGRWYDIEKARLQGGFKDSALIQNSLGVYESPAGTVVFYSHEGMPKFNDYGADGTVEAACSLLMGRAAGVFAPGDNMALAAGNGVFTKWHEETENGGNEVVIYSGLVYGFQKAAYRTVETANDATREDFGVCRMDAAAAWSA